MIRLDMECQKSGYPVQAWANDCIRVLRSVQAEEPVLATMTFNGASVPVFTDDDSGIVMVRWRAAKLERPMAHPDTMIGRRGRGRVE